MRTALLGVFCGVLGLQAVAQVRVVLPNCCTDHDSWLSIINPATGAVERTLNTGAVTRYSRGGSSGFALLKGGGSAAVLNVASPSTYAYRDELTVLDLATGKLSAPLTLLSYTFGADIISPLAVNPKSGLVYYAYANTSTPSNLTIEEINPATLTVIRTAMVTAYASAMVVSADGTRIYIAAPAGVTVLDTRTLQVVGTVILAVPAYSMAIAPDGLTLYVLSNGFVYFADTTNFQVTQTVVVPPYEPYGPFAASLDGSQLYYATPPVGSNGSLLVFNVSTLAVVTVPVPISVTRIVAAPHSTVYLLGQTQTGTEVAVFDSASQSVTRTVPVVGGPAALALSADGTRLYDLNTGAGIVSPVAVTAPAPSQHIEHTAPTGAFPTFGSGAYDAKDDLVLLPDGYGNVNVFDGATLRFKGNVNIEGLAGYVVFGSTGYAPVGIPCSFGYAFGIVRFDPVSLKVTGSRSEQCYWLFPIGYEQAVLHGHFIYAPYYVSNGDDATPGTAVFDTELLKLVANWPAAYVGLAVSSDGQRGYAILYDQYQNTSALASIDMRMGNVAQSLALPGSGYATNPVLSPDGGRIYTGLNGTLYLVSSQTLTITNSVPGWTLSTASISPDGAYIYGPTAIFSTSALQVVGTIPDSFGVPFTPIFVGK